MSHHHHIRQDVEPTASDVVEMLTGRPPSWLRAFLRLSTVHASVTAPVQGGGGRRQAWFRVAPAVLDQEGAWSMTFIWHPHAGHGVFERFHGRLVARHRGSGSTLELLGETDGGSPTDSEIVLSSLLALLAAAADSSVAQAPDG